MMGIIAVAIENVKNIDIYLTNVLAAGILHVIGPERFTTGTNMMIPYIAINLLAQGSRRCCNLRRRERRVGMGVVYWTGSLNLVPCQYDEAQLEDCNQRLLLPAICQAPTLRRLQGLQLSRQHRGA